MGKYIWLIVIVLMMAGCSNENKGPVTLTDESKVRTTYKSLTVSLIIQNNRDRPIYSDVQIDISDDWLVDHMTGDPQIFFNRKMISEPNWYRLDQQFENRLSFQYDLIQPIDKKRFIKAIDQGAVKVKVISKDGDVLSNKSIRKLSILDIDMLRHSEKRFSKIIFILLIATVIIVGVNKFIRKWIGAPKPDKKELPKVYRALSLIANLLVTVITPIMIGNNLIPSDFWNLLMIFVIIYIAFQCVIDLIFLKRKEFQVTLLEGLFLLLLISISSKLFPFIIY